MKADAQDIRSIFSNAGDVQYRLPRFQRAYAWGKEQWDTLWKDILHIHESSLQNPEHFMGAMVVVDDGERHGAMSVLSLVDGQQRLLTISILLLAMRNLCSNDNLREDISMFLINPRRDEDLRFKVLPTDLYDDQDTWKSLVKDQQGGSGNSLISDSYTFYKEKVQSIAKQGDADIETLFTTILEKLLFVYINLGRDERPYQIFESLNAKNVQLKLPDLIRNFVAMQLPESKEKDIFDHFWLPVEDILDERRILSRNRGELTYFLRHYLAMSGELPSFDRIYALFRSRVESAQQQDENGFEKEMASLLQHAEYYNCVLRPEQEAETRLREQLHRLTKLRQTTHYPYLLHLYHSYCSEEMDIDKFLNALKLLENYLVRYFLAAEPTNRLNNMFPSLIKEIRRPGDISYLQTRLMGKNYPSDDRIREVLKSRKIYSNANRSQLIFILFEINRRLSSGSDGETVLIGEPTIEHIMPQKLSPGWQESLGADFEQIRNDNLNYIGNLTLVTQGWNTRMSNSVYSEKRGNLMRHALLINSHYFNDVEYWNADTIQERTDWLVDHICKIWPSIGYRRSMDDWTRTCPTSLSIRGQSIPLEDRNWKSFVITLSEYLIDNTDVFANISDEEINNLRRYRPASWRNEYCHQLSNGWWLFTALPANKSLQLSEDLAERAGLSFKDWEFDFYRY